MISIITGKEKMFHFLLTMIAFDVYPLGFFHDP